MNSPAPDSVTFHLVLAEPEPDELVAVPMAGVVAPGPTAKWAIAPGAVRKLTFLENQPGADNQPAAGAVTAWLECVWKYNEPQLLLMMDDPDQVRLNGMVPPLIAVVRDGDRVRFGTEPALAVRLERSSPVGAARVMEVIGQVCPVCLTALEAADIVYRCSCGRVYHWNGEDNSRLQCGLAVGTCLGCEQQVLSPSPASSEGAAHHE